jgi:hypothetical protein
MIKEDASLGWRISSKLNCLPTRKHGKTSQIGMCVFAFGKLACKYFPKYLRLAQELAVKVASGILGRRVKYDILFPSEKTGDQSVETSNAATQS